MPASATHLRYLNGDGRDDRLENIAYGTWDDVLADHAARARREEAAGAPTRCPDGHRYADLYLQNYGNRLCRECNRLACAQRYRESGAVWNERARQATIAARAARGPRLSECVDCGAEVLNVDSGGTFKRCEPCRRAKELEKQRRRNEQRRAERLANPRQRITICVDCEAEIHHTAPSGPLSQRCEVCAKRRRRERQREYDRRRAKSPASRIKAS